MGSRRINLVLSSYAVNDFGAVPVASDSVSFKAQFHLKTLIKKKLLKSMLRYQCKRYSGITGWQRGVPKLCSRHQNLNSLPDTERDTNNLVGQQIAKFKTSKIVFFLLTVHSSKTSF